MAWNPNIPLATDFPSTSQSQINDNWSEIDTLVTVDHETFNQAANVVGKHKFVTFTRQGADRPTNNPNTNIALYSKLSAISGESELFFRRENNGSITEFTSSSATQSGWTRLPSGILIKWGIASANGLTTINFPGAPAPVFSNVFAIQITTRDSAPDQNHFAFLAARGTASFQAYGVQRTTLTTANVNFDYLAIGN